MASAFRGTNVILVDVAAALEVPTDGLTFFGLLRAVITKATMIGLPLSGGDEFSKLASISELMAEQMRMPNNSALAAAAAKYDTLASERDALLSTLGDKETELAEQRERAAKAEVAQATLKEESIKLADENKKHTAKLLTAARLIKHHKTEKVSRR